MRTSAKQDDLSTAFNKLDLDSPLPKPNLRKRDRKAKQKEKTNTQDKLYFLSTSFKDYFKIRKDHLRGSDITEKMYKYARNKDLVNNNFDIIVDKNDDFFKMFG